MSPKRDPVPRARTAISWLRGCLLLGVLFGGVVTAGVVLWQDLDIQRLTRSATLAEPITVPAALPPAKPAVTSHAYAAALYYSHASAGYFPDSSYYPDHIDRWEALAASTGARVSRVSSPAQVAALDASTVIIVPTAVCLGARELEVLRAHTERGGGLVITWASGARDLTCTWRGWSAVANLIGSREVREVDPRAGLYLTIPADLPLSPGFDPGTRLELRFESQLAADAHGSRVYWSDWALNVAPVAGTDRINAAALANVTEAGGRIVWFGFRLGQGARPEDEHRVDLLTANGLRWAASLPTAEILPWPGGARAALLLAQDVESQFPNAAALAALARRKSVPVTFFVVSQLALDYPELADSLTAVGEVGSQTSDHSVLSGLSYADQHTRLSRSWAELRGWTGDTTSGLHPPEERFDANTLRAWREAGGSYLVAVNEARTGSPEVFEAAGGEIVLLPRIIKDDYNVFVQESAMRSRRLAEAYLQGLEKAGSLGGLAVVSVRSQVGGQPGRIGVIGEVVDSARASGDWWIAVGRDISSWWSARRRTTIEFVETTDNRIAFEVTAPPDALLSGAWVHLLLPESSTIWSPAVDGNLAAYAETLLGVRIALPDLAPGARVTVTLRKEA
ncbi:MAG: polysaccharide deacetylase family protein [Gemmatimonadota bacterium]|nr:polysaccharide deacetylase family protein [Gemmatimonadota bacterium]